MADVAYVGTHAIRQQAALNINAAPIGGGTAGRMLNTLYGPNTSISDQTSMQPFRGSNYNGLQTQLSRREAGRLSSGVVYTYSKSMNYSDNGSYNGLLFSYPAYWDMNYALAGYDRKHNFQWWSIAKSPFGKDGRWVKSGLAGAALGEWQLQTILSWYSGTPFTVGASSSSLNAPGNSQVADRVKAVSIEGAHNYVGKNIVYFDTSAFAQPTGARFGNSGRNSLRGPGFFNLDAGLKKVIPVTERYKVELQIESFNVTNTPQFSNPNATLGSSSFGTITSTAGNSRRLRLSGRIDF